MPLANAYLRADRLDAPEPAYPLQVRLCEHCLLAQLDAVVTPDEFFTHYDYFSSYTSSLLTYSKHFAHETATALGLTRGDRVIEVASNDGYLLQYFAEFGMDVLGIEPAANVAAVALQRGIATHVGFFGATTARALTAFTRRARLIVANNVVAHVPDLHDFISGFDPLLAEGGVVSLECHHLLSLLEHRQFDTIYHEHLQYFSLHTLGRALAAHGLRVFRAWRIPTQGGSLRVWACRESDPAHPDDASVAEILAAEDAAGLCSLDTYRQFGRDLVDLRTTILAFLTTARSEGRVVAGYGAAAKGNTLLNYCGVTADLMPFVVDLSPHKQGLFLPGSHIPIYHPDVVASRKPDYLFLLPWNIQREIMEQMAGIRDWGGRFVVPIPTLRVLS